MSLEDQQEQQSLDMQNQFEDWFWGQEIQGDATLAVHTLADKVGKVISMETLMEAYYHVEPKKKEPLRYSDGTEIDDLPF